jgi:hypothetical protein
MQIVLLELEMIDDGILPFFHHIHSIASSSCRWTCLKGPAKTPRKDQLLSKDSGDTQNQYSDIRLIRLILINPLWIPLINLLLHSLIY